MRNRAMKIALLVFFLCLFFLSISDDAQAQDDEFGPSKGTLASGKTFTNATPLQWGACVGSTVVIIVGKGHRHVVSAVAGHGGMRKAALCKRGGSETFIGEDEVVPIVLLGHEDVGPPIGVEVLGVPRRIDTRPDLS